MGIMAHSSLWVMQDFFASSTVGAEYLSPKNVELLTYSRIIQAPEGLKVTCSAPNGFPLILRGSIADTMDSLV